MTSFALPKKKNLFKKQKEQEEEKRKKDEKETAAIYEEFLKDFGGPGTSGTFVRAGVIEPGKREIEASASRQTYSFKPAPGVGSVFGEEESRDEEAPPEPPKGTKPKKIDVFLENMKREQLQRELRKELNLPPAEGDLPDRPNHDVIDPGTTNVYVGNMAPTVDEQILLREFGRFGPLGSVKVMWPRDEEQRRRGRNTGFVLFMHREDAQRAMDAMDGVFLHDMPLTLGWGKALPLPAQPIWPPPGGLALEDGMPHYPAPPAPDEAGVWHWEDPAPQPARRSANEDNSMSRGIGPQIAVQPPADARQRFIIDAVAFYVMRDGCAFEQVLMERESSSNGTQQQLGDTHDGRTTTGNSKYAFLFDVTSPEHAYYRWRLYSLACGDSLRAWRVEPFVMLERSCAWLPPPMTAGQASSQGRTAASSSSYRKQKAEEGRAPLTESQCDRFGATLRTLTMSRTSVCEAMVEAIELADCAGEVAEMLCDAMTLPETPAPRRIARLYLLSDILHNATAPVRNASRFRAFFQPLLPAVFAALHEARASADSRIAQELLRRGALRVLRAWRGWFVFADDYLAGLQALLNGVATDDAGRAALERHQGKEDRLALESLNEVDLEAKCRLAGVPTSGGKSDRIGRLLAISDHLCGDQGVSKVTPVTTETAILGLVPQNIQAASSHPDNVQTKNVLRETGGWTHVADSANDPVAEDIHQRYLGEQAGKEQHQNAKQAWGSWEEATPATSTSQAQSAINAAAEEAARRAQQLATKFVAGAGIKRPRSPEN